MKLLFLLCLVSCNTVTVYDPPMAPNRVNGPCTDTVQCPFPTVCQKETPSQHGVCSYQ